MSYERNLFIAAASVQDLLTQQEHHVSILLLSVRQLKYVHVHLKSTYACMCVMEDETMCIYSCVQVPVCMCVYVCT